MRKALQIHKTWGTDVHAVGLGRTITHDVAAKFATRRFDRDIRLALGDLETFGEDLEVMDERFHGLVDTRTRRRRDFLVLDAVIALRHLLEALANDLD